MLSIRPVEAFHVHSEPGDGTRYEFLVSSVPDRPDALFITSVSRGHGCPIFVGYIYNIDSLKQFAKDHPEILAASTSSYQEVARAMPHVPFVDYACAPGHSGTYDRPANLWTGLAAILAGIRVLETLDDA